MQDSRTPEIVAQVVYKAHSEKGQVNFEAVKKDTIDLMKVIKEVGEMYEVPFNNATKRGGKAVGDPCKDCGEPLVQGKKGPYCRACYIAWKNSQQ